VVISIIALLIALLVPALSKAREQVMRTICAANLRQQGLAIGLYMNDEEGKFPPRHLENFPFAGPAIARETGFASGMFEQSLGITLWAYLGEKEYYFCPNLFEAHSNGWEGFNRDIGYVYFGNLPTGVPAYRNAPSDSEHWPGMLLMVDMIARWPVHDTDHIAHTSTEAEGGNGLYVDGHVEWSDIGAMSEQWIVPHNPSLMVFKWPVEN